MSHPSEEKNSDNDNHSQAFFDFPDFLNFWTQIMQHLGQHNGQARPLHKQFSVA